MKFINQIFYKKKVENKGKNFFLTNRNENDLKNLMFATSDLQFFRDLNKKKSNVESELHKNLCRVVRLEYFQS